MPKKIVVPRGMLDAALPFCDNQMHSALEAALSWLSENPIILSDKDAYELWALALGSNRHTETGHAAKDFAIHVQRRMFLESEPDIPNDVKDLIDAFAINGIAYKAVLEAYRRGKKSRGK